MKPLQPIIVFIAYLAILIPGIAILPQHGDERMYVWKSIYYARKLARMDFSAPDTESYLDPGFSRYSFWAIEQPFGTHAIYGSVALLLDLESPSLPWSWIDSRLQGPETDIPRRTLITLRAAAAICAAIGAALVVGRFGWLGMLATLLLLAIPHVRMDLPRAWAEGPLYLGIGLCAISYRSKWFPIACGLAAAFKLSAIILWPLMLIRGASGHWRFHILPFLITPVITTLLSPPAWFAGGPLILPIWIMYRVVTFVSQSLDPGTGPHYLGLFAPTRYFWPMELAFLLVMFIVLNKFRENKFKGRVSSASRSDASY